MNKEYIPVHKDLNLNDAWWIHTGLEIGKQVHHNVIREGSGRYDGYVISIPHGEVIEVKTTWEASIAVRLYLAQMALLKIRTAPYNTSAWAVWAQKIAAAAMKPGLFPEQGDAPEEEYIHDGWLAEDGTYAANVESMQAGVAHHAIFKINLKDK